MAPYPASLGGGGGGGPVMPRSTSAASDLALSALLTEDKRSVPLEATYSNLSTTRRFAPRAEYNVTVRRAEQNLTAALDNKLNNVAPRQPYLNSTVLDLAPRAEGNLTARAALNITERTLPDLDSTAINLTPRAEANLTTRAESNLTSFSERTFPPRAEYNVTVRDLHNLTAARSATNLSARSDENVTANSEHYIASRSAELPAQPPFLNFTTRSGHNLTAGSDYYVITSRQENVTLVAPVLTGYGSGSTKATPRWRPRSLQPLYPNVTARTDSDSTTHEVYNLTARAEELNVTELAGFDLAERGLSNLTARAAQNITARDEYNLTSRTAQNITARNEYNFAAPADLNLTTRSEFNITERGLLNLTSRADSNETDLADHKMIIRGANYNISGLSSGLVPKDGQAAHQLVSRATTSYMPCAGCTDPRQVNNKGFFALFAILGVAIVCTIIWFFFHAKNGGFVFYENDWDDYKSTVLRRKGPDGKTLSNATKSTRLGGGSIIAKHDRLAAMSLVGYDEKGRKGVKAKRGFGGTHSVYYSDDFSRYSGSRADDTSERGTIIPDRQRQQLNEKDDGGKHHAHRYRDRDVQHYKKEKAARVGGMNRPADGSAYDFSDTMTQMTESTNRSTTNLIRKNNNEKESSEGKKRAKAEKKARDEAARMERKWRKDAEEAARAIARDEQQHSPSPVPNVLPPQQAHRSRRADSSSRSKQQKRDYSFSRGQQDDISTVYTGTTGVTGDSSQRSASYYESYRPRHDRAAAVGASSDRETSRTRRKDRSGSRSPTKPGYRRYAESEAATSDSGTRIYEHRVRGSSRGPAKEKKKTTEKKGGRDVMAGYRRGRGGDSEDDF
ncbi:hypothetical protein AAFC00_000831 [Neodothiora populina]|uniref:Uncharacterized protein n=1 Tax=Neodothiora populina TaxID=2781224 RepID=A0ABR3PLW0_9PEZI